MDKFIAYLRHLDGMQELKSQEVVTGQMLYLEVVQILISLDY